MQWAISILMILGCGAVLVIAVLYVMRDLIVLTGPQLPSLWEYDYEDDPKDPDDDCEHA